MLRVLNIISARIKIRRILNIAEAEPNLPDTYKKNNCVIDCNNWLFQSFAGQKKFRITVKVQICV